MLISSTVSFRGSAFPYSWCCSLFSYWLFSCLHSAVHSNCLGPPAAPTIVSPVQLSCDGNQLSRLFSISWEAPSDTNCTHCTVLSTTTGYTSHQVVCDGGTAVSVELNCSETYNISFTTVNKCGQRSNITPVEITLSINGMYCTPTKL